MNILAGDIGGTKTILGVFSAAAGPRHPLAEMSFPSARYASLEVMVREFLAAVELELPIGAACFAVAGPVISGRAQITNLPWAIDSAALQSAFGLPAVALLNDMAGIAYAIPAFQTEDIYILNTGTPVAGGSIAVLAPGTGLGEGFLTWEQGGYRAQPSEGSHASFGPVGPLQIGLLTYLNEHGYDHVSFERVCSGGLGIPNLYSYLKTTGLEEPTWLAEQLAVSADPTPVIVNAAHDPARLCPLAAAVLDLFVAILGAEAGNLALKVLATGGLYLGGGVPPRILADLQKPAFLEAMVAKGRFRAMLSNMPVHVILDPKAGLHGAAAHARTLPNRA